MTPANDTAEKRTTVDYDAMFAPGREHGRHTGYVLAGTPKGFAPIAWVNGSQCTVEGPRDFLLRTTRLLTTESVDAVADTAPRDVPLVINHETRSASRTPLLCDGRVKHTRDSRQDFDEVRRICCAPHPDVSVYGLVPAPFGANGNEDFASYLRAALGDMVTLMEVTPTRSFACSCYVSLYRGEPAWNHFDATVDKYARLYRILRGCGYGLNMRLVVSPCVQGDHTRGVLTTPQVHRMLDSIRRMTQLPLIHWTGGGQPAHVVPAYIEAVSAWRQSREGVKQ